MDYKITYNIRYTLFAAWMGLFGLISCDDVAELTGELPATTSPIAEEAVPIRIKSVGIEAVVTKGMVTSITDLNNLALFVLADRDDDPDADQNFDWCEQSPSSTLARGQEMTAPVYNEPVEVTGDQIQWTDGLTHFYPKGVNYDYAFTCISPRIDNQKYIDGVDLSQRIDTFETLSHIVAHYKIDGRQDIIWGSCRGTDEKQWSEQYYRSHRHSDGMGGYYFDNETIDPSFSFHHLLTALSFYVEGIGSLDDINGIYIDSITVVNVPNRLMLHVAEKGIYRTEDQILVPDPTVKDNLGTLKLRDEDGNDVTRLNVTQSNRYMGTMLLYPGSSYRFVVHMHRETDETSVEWEQSVVRTLSLEGGSPFLSGHNYRVKIHVSGNIVESETE